MPKRKKIIQDKKLRGEWAEMQFMARAAEHGLSVSKPWGEMRPYDFVVGTPRHFASVQVKSTVHTCGTGYDCTVRGGHKAYPAGSFDFVAAYAVPEDVWYIIPAHAIRGKKSVTLFPKSKTARYEEYREAWHLLREATGGREETPEAEVAREEVSSAEDGSGKDEGAREQAPKRPPASALERMEASGKFFRDHLAGNGANRSRR